MATYSSASGRRAAFVVSLSFMLALPAAALQELKTQDYSTNAICSQRNCINPVFPGLKDLSALQAGTWQCGAVGRVDSHLRFCRGAVDYNVALPGSNTSESQATSKLVAEQEARAITAYRYHLAAMNKDAWEHRTPSRSDDQCVRAIWAMSCHTYLPQSSQGCEAGQRSEYLKPCRNVCESYVQACNVECCDESAKCVFQLGQAEEASTIMLSDSEVITSGYYDAAGPSPQCSGSGIEMLSSGESGGARGATVPGLVALLPIVLSLQFLSAGHSAGSCSGSAFKRAMLVSVLALLSTSLHGCDVLAGITGGHTTSAWQAKPSYLADFEFAHQAEGWQLPVGQSVLNSCELVGLPKERQCSGHGKCTVWNATRVHPLIAPMSFCHCNRGWADPECRTRRKSQAVAYTLSLFGGFLGLDRMYLGQYYTGLVKLSTLGGCGLWWIADVAYIGASPVYSDEYRLAADLPHWIFVATSSAFFAALGIVVNNYLLVRVQKRRSKAALQREQEEQYFAQRAATTNFDEKDSYGTLGA